ncbi:MAG: 4-hydroxyphenylacetate decarboxylase activase [Phascolarctobacterium sp.]|nr:4-hydroxyphenylacetate decarboxylase activase [Phascolarctobacterium sp.]
MSEKALLFDIQSFSTHDGPGGRTNVFFVGCPLQCRWCANPESWLRKKHLMYAQTVCKYEQGCRACRNVCPYGSITFEESGKPVLDWKICNKCYTFECVEVCPNRSLKQCVKEYTVPELMSTIRKHSFYWDENGGVTFSGGEPLLSHDFLANVLHECQKSGIHTAIETSGYAKEEDFLQVLTEVNFAFIDVKNMDPEAHKWGTGVSNAPILSNIEALTKSSWKGRLVLRQPTIGGFNDSKENALKVIEFMKRLDLYEINLLKFHRLGGTKWEQLGKKYEYSDHGDVSLEELEELQQIYLQNDIACYVAEETPF